MGWKEVLKPSRKEGIVAVVVFFFLFCFAPRPFQVIPPEDGWEFVSGPFPLSHPLDLDYFSRSHFSFNLTYFWIFLEAVGAYLISCLTLSVQNRVSETVGNVSNNSKVVIE
ncbi:hypothetical protein AKJ61_02360 [candidate division MSBL1 archaeon SCGC-AAA259B11]|uniref:Uncharacterized protein n=1 Tax=candidate division MSBL1 archaeon SCGC-AAA259B11 TaxID=1698260 RepID=A0A133U697_9EURY|nr:hypothetical protein AKJ61_02360 [candidate division MSBL1 archaeon SCGC-AAA259B11]